MEKVKLPKDVAFAISVMRANEISNYDIIKSLSSDYWYADAGYDDEDIKNANRVMFNYYINDTKNNPEKIIQALVNSYEIELTPNEQLKEYWDNLKLLIEKHDLGIDKGAITGIENTLNILGIKIEGINK